MLNVEQWPLVVCGVTLRMSVKHSIGTRTNKTQKLTWKKLSTSMNSFDVQAKDVGKKWGTKSQRLISFEIKAGPGQEEESQLIELVVGMLLSVARACLGSWIVQRTFKRIQFNSPSPKDDVVRGVEEQNDPGVEGNQCPENMLQLSKVCDLVRQQCSCHLLADGHKAIHNGGLLNDLGNLLTGKRHGCLSSLVMILQRLLSKDFTCWRLAGVANCCGKPVPANQLNFLFPIVTVEKWTSKWGDGWKSNCSWCPTGLGWSCHLRQCAEFCWIGCKTFQQQTQENHANDHSQNGCNEPHKQFCFDSQSGIVINSKISVIRVNYSQR